MVEDGQDYIVTANGQVVLPVLSTEEEHGVEGHLKLRAGPHEGAAHRLHLAVPLELDCDEMTSSSLFWLWEEGWGEVMLEWSGVRLY